MRNFRIKRAKPKKSKHMAGAVMIAVQKALRFETPMVVRAHNGRIVEISPKTLKQRLNRVP